MNNVINYYYGISVVDIDNSGDKYFFTNNGEKYCFDIFDRDQTDIGNIINLCIELKSKGILTNEIIINRYNMFITPCNGKMYVLIKENVKDFKINFNDILYIQNCTLDIIYNKKLIRSNHVNMWKKKIDYYERKGKDLCSKYFLIYNTLDYYIGLGENAISYLTNNKVLFNHVVLSHRRIDSKENSFDFYNPLNYILDSRSRDVADYIKILFFDEKVSYESIILFLKYANLNREEYILLFGRLLYPTYYFDMIDRIIFLEEDENILKKILKRNEAYIHLLKKMFYYVNYELKMNIPVIEWIIKKYN